MVTSIHIFATESRKHKFDIKFAECDVTTLEARAYPLELVCNLNPEIWSFKSLPFKNPPSDQVTPELE